MTIEEDLLALPEPPDGTRFEFEHWTDVFAMRRSDESSRLAGWPSGDGGAVWCMYGNPVPFTWRSAMEQWGLEALSTMVRLTVVPEDEPKRHQWPTQIHARKMRATEAGYIRRRRDGKKAGQPDE